MKFILGFVLAIPGAYTGIVEGWPIGFFFLFMGAAVLLAAATEAIKPVSMRAQLFESNERVRMFNGIPGYRVRIYAFLFALLCLGISYAAAMDLYSGLTTGQLDVYRGPTLHRVRETVSHDLRPWRFRGAILLDILAVLLCSCGFVSMARRVILGKRSIK